MDRIAEFLGFRKEVKSVQPSADYNFQRLNNSQKRFIETCGKDPTQLELTRNLLKNQNFQPTGSLQIDGKEFFVGKVIKSTATRDQSVMFYKGSDGKMMPRVLYKSQSDGGWRVCPGVEPGPVYGKGKGIHYTQETKPHRSIVQYLEEAEAVNHIGFYKGDIIYDYFNIGVRSAAWNTFDRELQKYEDRGVLFQFQRFQPGHFTKAELGSVDLAQEFMSIDFSKSGVREFVPNFESIPVRVDKQKHTLLGVINTESYSASLNGRPVEWVMAYDRSGRVWIDRISFLDNKINSFGISPEVIDSGFLTSKPLEYRSLCDILHPRMDFVDFQERYVDITPLLDNLKPIQDFRKARGIGLERIPGQVNPLTLHSARSFDELYNALSKTKGLQGSRIYYSPSELVRIINGVRNGSIELNAVTRTGDLRSIVQRLLVPVR